MITQLTTELLGKDAELLLPNWFNSNGWSLTDLRNQPETEENLTHLVRTLRMRTKAFGEAPYKQSDLVENVIRRGQLFEEEGEVKSTVTAKYGYSDYYVYQEFEETHVTLECQCCFRKHTVHGDDKHEPQGCCTHEELVQMPELDSEATPSHDDYDLAFEAFLERLGDYIIRLEAEGYTAFEVEGRNLNWRGSSGTSPAYSLNVENLQKLWSGYGDSCIRVEEYRGNGMWIGVSHHDGTTGLQVTPGYTCDITGDFVEEINEDWLAIVEACNGCKNEVLSEDGFRHEVQYVFEDIGLDVDEAVKGTLSLDYVKEVIQEAAEEDDNDND